MCVDFSKLLNLELENENENDEPHEIHHTQHVSSVTHIDWTGLEGDPPKGKDVGVRGPTNNSRVQKGSQEDPQKNHDPKPEKFLPCDDMNHVQEIVESGNVQSLQVQGNCNDVAINPQAPEFSGKEKFGTSHESQPGLPLTVEVDPNLRGSHQFPESVPETLTRPPDIASLRQWGQLKIPSGKHAGKTFSEAHQDLGYRHQVWNRRAVSSWLRSFQMYCRMVQHMRPDETAMSSTQVIAEPVMTQSPQPNKAAKPITKVKETMNQTRPLTTVGEWIEVEKPNQVAPSQGRVNKRGSTTASSNRMSTKADPEKIQKLRTQIAILERELANELQIPDDSSDEKTQKWLRPPFNSFRVTNQFHRYRLTRKEKFTKLFKNISWK